MKLQLEAIKTTFSEMFKKHEDNRLKIIAANHRPATSWITKEITGLKECLEFTLNNTEEKLQVAEGVLKKITRRDTGAKRDTKVV